MGSLQAGYPKGLRQIAPHKVDDNYRQGHRPGFPFVQQSCLHPVGLGLHRIDEHARHLGAVDVTGLRGVGPRPRRWPGNILSPGPPAGWYAVTLRKAAALPDSASLI